MKHFLLTWILIILAAVFNAIMDNIAHGKLKLFGSWFDPEVSWRRKYKNGDPDQGEAYPLASTMLSWTTDGWHFFQMCFHTCWQLAIAVNFDYMGFFIHENFTILSGLKGGAVETIRGIFVFLENLNSSNLYSMVMNTIFVKFVFGMPFEFFYKKISELKANDKFILD